MFTGSWMSDIALTNEHLPKGRYFLESYEIQGLFRYFYNKNQRNSLVFSVKHSSRLHFYKTLNLIVTLKVYMHFLFHIYFHRMTLISYLLITIT